jgi:hypothetical protein
MCLLTQQFSSTQFSDEFLTSVYARNQDGLGVMYADGGKLHIFKCLPASAQEFIDFYRTHAEGRDCVWHARMQTHGDIDMDNCHPYRVTDDIWMAHNGILATGNDADQTRSDTWHFIDKVLRPSLTANPDLLKDHEWLTFMGKMIGAGNKFAFVSNDGTTAIVNKSSGTTYEGAWLSNTYAWASAKFLGGGYTNMYSGQRKAYGSYYDQYYSSWDDEASGYQVGTKTTVAKGSVVKSQHLQPKEILKKADVAPMVRAAYNQWVRRGLRGVEQWVYDAPYKAEAVLMYWYEDLDGIEDLVNEDPMTAAEWIADLFDTDSFSPSLIN